MSGPDGAPAPAAPARPLAAPRLFAAVSAMLLLAGGLAAKRSLGPFARAPARNAPVDVQAAAAAPLLSSRFDRKVDKMRFSVLILILMSP